MKLTKLQIATIIIFVIYFIWEVTVQLWARAIEGPVIRVDLVLIFPVLLLMIILVVIQRIRKNKD